MTKEQYNESQRNHRKAIKYFEWIGLLPKDRKPHEYHLHHIDESLRHNDVDRYIQWNGYDLEVIKGGEHLSHHHKGKIVTEETRLKQSESHKGYVMPEEQKRKISESEKGREVTDEFREKMRQIAKSRGGWCPYNHWKIVDGKRVYYNE